MNPTHPTRPTHPARLTHFLLPAMLALATAVHAQAPADQTAPPPPTTTEPIATDNTPASATLQLDIARLLSDPAVDAERFSDPLWTLEPKPGRTLTFLPIRITPGSPGSPGQQPTTLARPNIAIAGGRFLAWWIPPADDDANKPPRNHRQGNDEFSDNFQDTPRFIAGDHRFAHMLGDPNADVTNGAFDPTPTRQQEDPDAQGPRLARAITVTPGGTHSPTHPPTVTWKLDRAISNAELNSGDGLYILKISPQRLQELAPARPERLTRNTNESSHDYNQRRQADQAKNREEQAAFRATRAAVQNLPEKFQAPLPPVVWAVIERPQGRPNISFQGPAPLPWSLPSESFDAMRALAGGTSRGRDTDDASALAAIQAAVDSGHPLSLHAAAAALAGSDLLSRAQPGDPISRLTQALLQSQDGPAIRATVNALAAVSPPTPGTRRLLDTAAQGSDPLAKLAALQASLNSEVSNPATVARVVQQADAVLADPQGPPPAFVLAGLIESTQDQPIARQALMAGVRFDRMAPDRREQAIRFVAGSAQEPQGLAAGWLDAGMLGSTDRTLVRQTLEILAQPNAGPSALTPFTQALRQRVFKTRQNTDTTDANTPTPYAGPPIQNLALTSNRHALFTALQSGDPQVRTLAWEALRHFTITQSRGRNTPPNDDPLAAILSAATAQPTTPPSLVAFLERQTQGPRATAALMQLAAQGDGRLAGRAVRALLKKPAPSPNTRNTRPQKRQLQQAMRELDPALRAGFAQAIYTHAGTGATPVAGLATDDKASLWFAEQLEDGTLAQPAQWVQAVGGEIATIDLAAHEDDALAHGALAALAAAAGADTQGQYAVIDQLGDAPRSADDLQAQWPAVKKSIQIAQLDSAVGDYRLTVEIAATLPSTPATSEIDDHAFNEFEYQEAGFQAPPPGAIDAPQDASPIRPLKVVLGIVELVVENDAVRLAGDPITLAVPDDLLALRIADPLQLRNFPNEKLQDVPLEQATPPLDLLRNDQGTWSGSTPIGNSHTLHVTMQPL